MIDLDKRIEEVAQEVWNNPKASVSQEEKELIRGIIKDCLRAVRPELKEMPVASAKVRGYHNGIPVMEPLEYAEKACVGWNEAVLQFTENCEQLLGEKLDKE